MAFPPSPAMVGSVKLGLGAGSGARMLGRWHWMAGYMDWLSNEQRGSRCWQCASAMWGGEVCCCGWSWRIYSRRWWQALIWIWSPWFMVGVPRCGYLFRRVVGGGDQGKALRLGAGGSDICGCLVPLEAPLCSFSCLPTLRMKTFAHLGLTRRRRRFVS